MVPLYLPMATDGPDATEGAPLFFGGIGVYLAERSAFFREAPRWCRRLLDSPRLLKWAAKRAEMTKPSDLGEPTLSILRGEDGQQVRELERLIAWLAARGRPDVLCLSNALLVGMARRMKQELGVPILCTLQDEDAFLDALPEPYASQAWNLVRERAADVDVFLPVSRYYGNVMAERLALAPERVHVVPIGIDLAGYAPAGRGPETPTIGYLAQLRHANGLDLLVEAFLAIRAGGRVPGVRLRVSGAATRGDRRYLATIEAQIREAGAADDVEFFPILEKVEKQEFLRSLSVLSVPAREGVAFGTFIIEAAASGVPVVQPRVGAFAELIEATGSGVLVEPDDTEALTAAVEDLLLRPDKARALGRRGRAAAMEQFSIERMAQGVAHIIESVVSKARA